jgi:hypothetical protein
MMRMKIALERRTMQMNLRTFLTPGRPHRGAGAPRRAGFEIMKSGVILAK